MALTQFAISYGEEWLTMTHLSVCWFVLGGKQAR